MNSVLKTYNLIDTVIFPLRIWENSSTTTDNIFLVISKHGNYRVPPLHDGLLDHEAQFLMTDIQSGDSNIYLLLYSQFVKSSHFVCG